MLIPYHPRLMQDPGKAESCNHAPSLPIRISAWLPIFSLLPPYWNNFPMSPKTLSFLNSVLTFRPQAIQHFRSSQLFPYGLLWHCSLLPPASLSHCPIWLLVCFECFRSSALTCLILQYTFFSGNVHSHVFLLLSSPLLLHQCP